MENKNKIRGIVVLAILLVAFSVVAFVIPFAKNGVFWCGYIFAVIAIGVQAYVFMSSWGNNADAKSKFYGFPIVRVGITYLIVQLAVSMLEIILAKICPLWGAVAANILLLAIAAIGLIGTEIMRDEVVKQDEEIVKNVNNMRKLQKISAGLAGASDNSEIKAMVTKLAEELRFSDPVSSEQTEALEEELTELLMKLCSAVEGGNVDDTKDFCAKIHTKLNERNRVCAMSK